MNNKILMTGGGSAGHVTLNLALIPLFLEKGWKVVYIGSYGGIERDLIAKYAQVRYYPIATGKLRRYFSWQNFADLFKIPVGILQAIWIVFKEKPDIVFSKGGFVSFPVVLAGSLSRCPVAMHESDVTPGLANKMSLPFVSKFFTTFEETVKYVKDKQKVCCVGPILTDRFNNGNIERACQCCEFDLKKPIIMVIGGSLGAKSLNAAIRRNLSKLTEKYQIIHICGRGLLDNEISCKGYRQFEYVDQELKDFMAAAEVVISRAGSNSIFELRSLAKPMIMVPLPTGSSRGEQMLNAQSFQKQGFGEVIADEDLSNDQKFINLIDSVFANRAKYRQKMLDITFKSTDNARLCQEIIKLSKQ